MEDAPPRACRQSSGRLRGRPPKDRQVHDHTLRLSGALRLARARPADGLWPYGLEAMKESKGKAKKVQAPKANASQPSLKDMPTLGGKQKK
jgi:hypothetical protein